MDVEASDLSAADAKCLRAIPLPAGVLPINHNLSVISCSSKYDLSCLRERLTCDRSQDWIQRHAARLENGYLSITTTLLRELPVED